MTTKFISAAAWAFLGFIIFATLSPLDLRPSLTATEPTIIVLCERSGAFAMLGILFFISYPKRTAFVWIVVLGSAIALELAQIVIADRDARVVDAIEKLFGGTVGILAARAFL